jgi:hypothetical protein
MKRIYFLVPDIDVARTIVNEALLARIEERRIHILARRGTPLEDLPEASALQKSDFAPAIQRGLAMGGGVGILAGLVGLALSPGAVVIAGGIILAAGLGGAGAGAWIGGMVGLSAGNSHLKSFEDAIERGELLIMLDVPRTRVDEITERVKLHHPLAQPRGADPDIPVFP